PELNDTTLYYVTAMRDGCINPERVPVVVNVGAPEAPEMESSDVSVCVGGDATLRVKNPEAEMKYVWYTKATGGTALDTATSFTVNSVIRDTAFYVVAVNANNCTSTSRTKVTITAANAVSLPALL